MPPRRSRRRDPRAARTPAGEEHTIRLYGVDCPEHHVNGETDARRLRTQRRYFGIAEVKSDATASIEFAKRLAAEAMAETRRLLAKPFTVHTSFADGRGDGRFKRIYAFVTDADGRDLAEQLVSRGLARAFGVARGTPAGESGEEYRERLADLELQAAKRGSGIWAHTDWDKLPVERRLERLEEHELKQAIDGTAPPPAGFTLDPNTASRDELMRLPGVGETLRINGRASISVDPDLISRFPFNGTLPRSVIVVKAERVYFQCPKALIRSELWNPDKQISRKALPSTGKMLADITTGMIDGEQYDRDYPERLKATIY